MSPIGDGVSFAQHVSHVARHATEAPVVLNGEAVTYHLRVRWSVGLSIALSSMANACLLTVDESRVDVDAGQPAPTSACDGFAGPVLDIRDYGALCDGKDDFASIKKAFEALPPTGGTLVISCNAAVTGALFVAGSKIAIRGPGGLHALTLPVNASSIVVVNECSDCAVCGLTLDGGGKAGGIKVIGAPHTTLEGNMIANAPGFPGIAIGVATLPEESPIVSGNTVHDVVDDGIVVYATNATLTGNVVQDVHGRGLHLNPEPPMPGTWRVEKNIVRRCGSDGISFANDAAAPSTAPVNLTGLALNGNTAEANLGSGISAAWSVSLSNATIASNILHDNHENDPTTIRGQLAIAAGQTIAIHGNEISDTRAQTDAGRADRGIVLYAQKDLDTITISGNHVANHAYDGIALINIQGGKLNGATLTDDVIEDNSEAGVFIQEVNAGDIANVVLGSGNCFSGNGATLIDLRMTALAPPPNAVSCAP